MRKRNTVFSISAALLLIAGCSAEPGTGPAGQTSSQAPADATEDSGFVRLSGEGLRTTGPDGINLNFSAPRDATEKGVTAALGEPETRARNDECGAGPIETTNYPSGLTLNFQRGYLVGWFLRSTDAQDRVTTAESIGTGSAMEDARKVYAVEQIQDSTLGEEYATDEGIGIFLGDGGAVDSLYAGTNCFFR